MGGEVFSPEELEKIAKEEEVKLKAEEQRKVVMEEIVTQDKREAVAQQQKIAQERKETEERQTAYKEFEAVHIEFKLRQEENVKNLKEALEVMKSGGELSEELKKKLTISPEETEKNSDAWDKGLIAYKLALARIKEKKANEEKLASGELNPEQQKELIERNKSLEKTKPEDKKVIKDFTVDIKLRNEMGKIKNSLSPASLKIFEAQVKDFKKTYKKSYELVDKEINQNINNNLKPEEKKEIKGFAISTKQRDEAAKALAELEKVKSGLSPEGIKAFEQRVNSFKNNYKKSYDLANKENNPSINNNLKQPEVKTTSKSNYLPNVNQKTTVSKSKSTKWER